MIHSTAQSASAKQKLTIARIRSDLCRVTISDSSSARAHPSHSSPSLSDRRRAIKLPTWGYSHCIGLLIGATPVTRRDTGKWAPALGERGGPIPTVGVPFHPQRLWRRCRCLSGLPLLPPVSTRLRLIALRQSAWERCTQADYPSSLETNHGALTAWIADMTTGW